MDCGGTRGHADSCDECICYEQGEIDGKPLLSCGSRGDCGGDCQWKSSGSSGGMCVRKQGTDYSERAPVHNVVYNVVVFTISGDGNSTKEPGIDPGLTEKPDPAWSLMWRSRTWPRNSSASRAEELEPTKRPTFEGEKGTYIIRELYTPSAS